MDSQFRARLMAEIEPLRMIDRLRGGFRKSERAFLAESIERLFEDLDAALSRISQEDPDGSTAAMAADLRITQLDDLHREIGGALATYATASSADWKRLKASLVTLEDLLIEIDRIFDERSAMEGIENV